MRHKDKIEDLIKWKHTPDHFYFVKFFDPYIKRDYEVLRTAAVNNSAYLHDAGQKWNGPTAELLC